MGAIKSVAGIAGGAGDVIGGLFGKKDDAASAKDTAPCNTALTGKPTLAPKKKSSEKKSSPKAKAEEALKDPGKLIKGLFD